MARKRTDERMNQLIRTIDIKWEKVADRAVYPWSLPVFRNFEPLELDPRITIFVGENGSGKSTLLEGIAEAVGINSEGGSRNHNFATTQHFSPVAKCLRVVRGARRPQTEFFLRAESFYNVSTAYEEMPIECPEPLRDLHFSSHGEGFLRIAMERFGPGGLYLLDEPESALSPQNLLKLMVRMNELIGQGSQFIVATHSPILMAFPNARIYSLSDEGIAPIDYRDTSHFQITKRFINDPESFLRKLLE
jgi:predicted ATPase